MIFIVFAGSCVESFGLDRTKAGVTVRIPVYFAISDCALEKYTTLRVSRVFLSFNTILLGFFFPLPAFHHPGYPCRIVTKAGTTDLYSTHTSHTTVLLPSPTRPPQTNVQSLSFKPRRLCAACTPLYAQVSFFFLLQNTKTKARPLSLSILLVSEFCLNPHSSVYLLLRESMHQAN